MCDDLDAVEIATKLGAPINESCCAGTNPKTGTRVQCPFFETCAYERQKQHEPDVWIVAHELLFTRQDAIKGVELIFIDETFYGVRHPSCRRRPDPGRICIDAEARRPEDGCYWG